MEQANQELVIILPESMENMPVRIIRDEATEELTVQVLTLPTPDDSPSSIDKRHTTIWHQNQYENIPLNDILWVEANGEGERKNGTAEQSAGCKKVDSMASERA